VVSWLTKKVPLETQDGKVIESKTQTKAVDFWTWDFPNIKLLNEIEHKNLVSLDEIEEKSLMIQKTFLQFGIDVEMEDECVGPTVIQYRLRPSEWVRLSKIEALKKISLSHSRQNQYEYKHQYLDLDSLELKFQMKKEI